MKTIKSYVFVVATIPRIVATTTLKAQTTFSEGIFNYEVNPDGTTVTITGYDDSEIEDLVIPTAVTHEGTDYNVTAIGDYSFFMKTNLTGSLTLPNTMTLIDDYAFCSPFTGELVIPNTVTILAENPPYTENLVADYTINSLIVPCESLNVYHNSEWAQYFSEIIEDCGHEAVSELDEDLVSVFPNPTSGVVKIEAEGVENVKVYNALGEMVFVSETTDSIDLSVYGTGIYLIRIKTVDGVVTKRIKYD